MVTSNLKARFHLFKQTFVLDFSLASELLIQFRNVAYKSKIHLNNYQSSCPACVWLAYPHQRTNEKERFVTMRRISDDLMISGRFKKENFDFPVFLLWSFNLKRINYLLSGEKPRTSCHFGGSKILLENIFRSYLILLLFLRHFNNRSFGKAFRENLTFPFLFWIFLFSRFFSKRLSFLIIIISSTFFFLFLKFPHRIWKAFSIAYLHVFFSSVLFMSFLLRRCHVCFTLFPDYFDIHLNDKISIFLRASISPGGKRMICVHRCSGQDQPEIESFI